MTYGTINADVISTSTSGGVLGAGNASIMKNRIINGAMVVNQRGWTGTIVTDGTYTLDRYQAFSSAASKYSVVQSTDAPTGFINSLLVTSLAATSVGATDYYFIRQAIEGLNCTDLGWGGASAKTVTVSFWVKSSLTGTFGGTLENNAQNRSYPFSYTISSANTWEQKTITVAGDTTGTWLTTNGIGIMVQLGLGVGSTYSDTANAWTSKASAWSATGATSVVGTSGATLYITAVQLEVGSSATGFEYVNYQTSLANCQRYYEKSYNADVVPATATAVGAAVGGTYDGGTIGVVQARFAVAKRATATVAVWGTDGTSNVVVDNANRTATITNIGMAGASITYAGNGNFLGYTQFTASAEL